MILTVILLQQQYIIPLANTVFDDEPKIAVFGDKLPVIQNFSSRTRPIILFPDYARNQIKKSAKFFEQSTRQTGQCYHYNIKPEKPNCTKDVLNQKFYVMQTHSFARYEQYFDKLQPGQLINRLPGRSVLLHKNSLTQAINKYQRTLKFNSSQQIFPQSFILPDNAYNLKKYMADGKWVIAKPSNSYAGKGIILTNRFSDIPLRDYVAQEYITGVLMQNHKIDLRIMVLVTSLDPLIAYTHRSGFVKAAFNSYQKLSDNKENEQKTHLTNVAVNFGHDDRELFTDSGAHAFFPLHTFMSEIDQPDNIYDFKFIQEFNKLPSKIIKDNINQMVTRTLIQTYKPVLEQAKVETSRLYDFPRPFFGLLGLDVMLSKNGTPVLLEVNDNTMISKNFNLDPNSEYNDLLIDMYNLIGIRINIDEDNVINPEYAHDDKRIWRSNLTYNTSMNLHSLKATQNIEYNKLTKFEQRSLMQIKDEATRLGEFQRLKFEDYEDEFYDASYLTKLMYKWIQQEKQQINK
ncbi:Tubulin_tyrosine ligase [Hexamita inflata]|uniref:Tubulin tyrosine ligase n=1 Tax=Hexamita inflata TaxID=28002 RepID=A0AA86UK96_9EUKA|nr:Tubulin tyrosine ligase [Hexamita inflata]CAI9954716.1 Tubulin tyrosine ligase [Hexamita inflata]